MQEKIIQIVSFDTPFPPKYGGAIDVFYKIKSLHAIGYKIILHSFAKQPNTISSELTNLIHKSYFYKLDDSLLSLISLLPISVRRRNSKLLITNLKKVNAPILFESSKVTGLLDSNTFPKMYLRLHNIESDYFRGLAKSESNYFKKALYFIESLKFRHFEKNMNVFDAVFTLSRHEQNWSLERNRKSQYIPLFHGNEAVKKLSPFGKYAIYSGDMQTADNRKAVKFLVSVFNQIPDFELVIVVSDRVDFVQNEIGNVKNCKVVKIENYVHLQGLLAEAHINVMVSFQASGTKLKLVNALFNSRHCLINENMVDDKTILSLCEIAVTQNDFIAKIQALKSKPYSDFENRESVLSSVFNDKKNAQKLIDVINNGA